MIKEEPKYEEWLTTIVNTRFLYNTMEEIEVKLDNHSIHSNGIKRSFNTPQKMRSAFRDLKVEAYSLTDETLLLDKVFILAIAVVGVCRMTWLRSFHGQSVFMHNL